ncbi:hypothetical protein VP01_11057g1, partial [Puccinia sorghi]
IIGDLFKKLAHEPFQKNQDLMKKFNLPSLSDLSYVFSTPQKNTEDISQFAFVLFLSTCSSDGSLVDGSEYDITSGPLLFPDHKFVKIFADLGCLSKSTIPLLMLVSVIIEAFIKRLHIILVIIFFICFVELANS